MLTLVETAVDIEAGATPPNLVALGAASAEMHNRDSYRVSVWRCTHCRIKGEEVCKHRADENQDPVTCPTDYAALHEQYWDFIVGLVCKLGIEQQSAEDVASDIMVRLQVTDAIGQFDDSYHIEHRGTTYKPRFQSFLSAKVEHYCRSKRERQGLRGRREPLLCDQPVGESETPWVELFLGGASDEFVLCNQDFHDTVERLRDYLSFCPVKGKRDLVRLFETVLQHVFVEKLDRPNRRRIAADFGISETAVGSMIADLRAEIRDCLAGAT